MGNGESMNKFGKAVLAAVLAASLAVTPVFAAPDVEGIRQSKEASENALESLKNDLAKTIENINELEGQLIETGEKIAQAEVDLAAAQEKEDEQYEAMKLRIRYMYEEGNTSFLTGLLESKSISEVLNKAEYIQNVHQYDRQKLEEYVDTKKQVETLKAELEQQQTELMAKQAEFEQEKANISTMVEEKRAEVAELDEQLQAAIVQAAAEEAARRAAEEAANQSASNNNSNSNNDNRPTDQTDSNVSSGNSNVSGGNTSQGGSGDTSVAQAIVNAAYSQLGVPYVWGGTTPGSGLDCSGLTQYAHRVAGISIPRTSGPQGSGGKAVSNPLPGDIVCYSGHVGIYIGGGQMIHAPQPGDVVKVANVYGSPWYRRYW